MSAIEIQKLIARAQILAITTSPSTRAGEQTIVLPLGGKKKLARAQPIISTLGELKLTQKMSAATLGKRW
jgi:hypothetical protein